MCSLGRGMRISFQSHAGSVFFSSRTRSFCSCSAPVGSNRGSSGKAKTLKLQSSAKSGRPEVLPGLSYNQDSSKFNDVIHTHLPTLGYNKDKCEGDDVMEARNVAIGFLASRAISVAELRKKLTGKKYPRKLIDSVIADLRDRGMVNDELYAESFSRSRWLGKTWGPWKIKKALLDKGISGEVADKATTRLFEEEDPNASDEIQLPGISQLSLDHLFAQASKQWLRYENKCPEKKKSSMIRWLQYRGFNWDTIRFTLEKLESDAP